MTMITEYRLKCDYCGATSPVFTDRQTHGWVTFHPQEFFSTMRHFCIPAHHEAWLAQQQVEA